MQAKHIMRRAECWEYVPAARAQDGTPLTALYLHTHVPAARAQDGTPLTALYLHTHVPAARALDGTPLTALYLHTHTVRMDHVSQIIRCRVAVDVVGVSGLIL